MVTRVKQSPGVLGSIGSAAVLLIAVGLAGYMFIFKPGRNKIFKQ